jgi:hypothetical protein
VSESFSQQLLVPPVAVEVRIRMGFVPERDHAQVQVEVVEPTSRAILAMWSRPHTTLRDWPNALEEAVDQANRYAAEFVEPF